MSHNSKYYRKKVRDKTAEKCSKIDILFKQQALRSDQSNASSNEPQSTAASAGDDRSRGETVLSAPNDPEDVHNNDSEENSDSHSESDTSDSKSPEVPVPDSRLFCSSKYELKYPWIYFSSAKGGYVCKHCEFWDGSGKTSSYCSPFVTGIQLGSHPSRKLEKHCKSEGHIMATSMYMGGFMQSQSVLQMVRNQERMQIAEDRQRANSYMTVLFKTAYFMLHKRWAITDNLGEMMTFLANDLEFNLVSDYYQKHHNLRYTSPSSVRDIISSLSFAFEDCILTDLRNAKWYALLADESSDDANREQFAILVRYLKDGAISEVFLGLIHVNKTDAESLMTAIETFLIAKNVDITKAIFVGFDGCNTMSGVNTGLQRRFRNHVPHQIYINCRNHRLALCLKHLIKEFPVLAELDELLIGIWKLFHYSPQRYHVLMEIQQTYCMTKLKFIRAAATRWLSHGRACSRLLDRYVPILDSLDAIFAMKRDPEITGLRNMLTDKKMVAVATVLCDILKPVVLFSDYLQGDVHFSRVNLRLKELIDSLSHLVRRFQACAGGQRDTDLYLDRLTDLWEEIDDRILYARRLRALDAALTLNQVVVEIAVPMIHGLINELSDAFHCSPVLDGFRVFDLREIPGDVAELGQYGETEIHNLAAHYGRTLVDTFQGHGTQAQPTFTQDVYIQQFAGFKHQMFLISLS